MQHDTLVITSSLHETIDLNNVLKKQEDTFVKKVIINVDAHAQVTIVYHQYESDDVTLTIIANAYAKVDLRCIITAPSITRHTITAVIQGVGASINGVIAYALAGDAAYYLVTRQEHNAPHGNSSIKVRGLLHDVAISDYRSTIFVAPAAAHTVALQEHKTLLMGSAARSIAIPSLEVLTHEVQCKHGSASGQLDEQQLYYMQARGISYQKARRIVLEVFFAALLGYENHDDIQRLMFVCERS